MKEHQLAFSLSLQFPSAAHDPESNSDLLHQCDNFWKNNCLFMVPEVRESFRVAYQTVRFYPSYKDNHEKGKISDKELKEVWQKIIKSTHDIVESVGFKWLGDLEPIDKEQAETLLQDAKSAYEEMNAPYFVGIIEKKLEGLQTEVED